jgi:hypothetical protein
MAMPWLNDLPVSRSNCLTMQRLPPFYHFRIYDYGGNMAVFIRVYYFSFKPALIKRAKRVCKGSGGIRKVLVVVQFSISIIMIIPALITINN